mmetsp:Transcript_1574/g.3839  ORF Transcript_1574/g.3839 Transcript_1574/m.3839 type:complete len:223 (+) Transcript_1574:146-814(+)
MEPGSLLAPQFLDGLVHSGSPTHQALQALALTPLLPTAVQDALTQLPEARLPVPAYAVLKAVQAGLLTIDLGAKPRQAHLVLLQAGAPTAVAMCLPLQAAELLPDIGTLLLHLPEAHFAVPLLRRPYLILACCEAQWCSRQRHRPLRLLVQASGAIRCIPSCTRELEDRVLSLLASCEELLCEALQAGETLGKAAHLLVLALDHVRGGEKFIASLLDLLLQF